MTQHSRMSTGRLLEQNQKHVCAVKQDQGLGRVMCCCDRRLVIGETSQKLLVLKCHNPGRARLLGKNLAEAAISKDGIFLASDCGILNFICLFHPSQAYIISSQLLPPQTRQGRRGREQHPSASEAQGLCGPRD